MTDTSGLVHGVGNYISARFEKAGIGIQKIIDDSASNFNFWYLKVGYRISFHEDKHKRAHFSMRISDSEGICSGLKECIDNNARSNSEIEKTPYLSKKEVSEQKAETYVIDIGCSIKKIPSSEAENDEKTFYNMLWAYIIQPSMRGVGESIQRHENMQKRKCA